jgi:transcriptional regulator with GAF, ATPase, and Fis domain
MIEHPLSYFRKTQSENVFHQKPIATELFEGTDQDLYEAYLRYRFLYEFAQLIASQTQFDKIIDTLLDKLIELINAERCLLLLYNQDGDAIYKISRNLQPAEIDHPEFMVSRSIIAHVKETQQPVCLQNVLEDGSFNQCKSVLRLRILSVACMPIRQQNQCLGLLYADNRSIKNAFKRDYCEVLQDFVSLISGPLAMSIQHKKLENQILTLQRHMQANSAYPSIIGTSPQIQKVLKFVDQVADTTATVILEGESGTGKELVARALHDHSRRKIKPFVSLNCGALTETLLESELFGHIKGSFTGAIQNKKGWFETADGGTIFFDEISEMSPGLQVKLLRILQTGEYSPVGSNEIKKTDVRIIVATNKHLETMVKQGTFRSDLFYRLNILYLCLPPLRERREDILLLAHHYLKTFGDQLGKENLVLSFSVQEVLQNHDFPGNIRELQNIMQRAAVITDEVEVQMRHLPESFVPGESTVMDPSADNFAVVKKAVVERFERDYVVTTLDKANGIIAQAAKIAGIDPKNFYQKMQKYQIKTTRR